MKCIPSIAVWLLAVQNFVPVASRAQEIDRGRVFEQMGSLLPSPNSVRTGGGSPGRDYWQQWVDYDIQVVLDEVENRISGTVNITYYNRAPVALEFLWLQLDQNIRALDAHRKLAKPTAIKKTMSIHDLRAIYDTDTTMGFKIAQVVDTNGMALRYTINNTMMRIDLPDALESGAGYAFSIQWDYKINDMAEDPGRSGMEFFPGDNNYQYNIAQFYPRMAVYNDVGGWQNKQYLGEGEFGLPFGRYTVSITVPSDHIVGATGTLVNAEQVLTPKQIRNLRIAADSEDPVFIVSPEEAASTENEGATDTRTWIFEADSVRDFAFVTSRKLIWEAMGLEVEGRTVMVMSMYPKESQSLYSAFATRVAAHTVSFYSEYLFPYPYSKVLVVEANMGMEYPMVAFTYGRPDEEGSYSDWLKRAMISVIIHEVGHNYFPMVINSDERQWAWMDEGLNSFVQFLAEQAWQPDYPSRRGSPEKVIPYMKRPPASMVPIMTNPEQLKQKGNNAYLKAATALSILRETVMGETLFDDAFRIYCKRWAFKHPTPADFFRTMEEASAVDLDWFWKGWFYTTDPVDLEISDVVRYQYENRMSPGSQPNEAGKKKTGKNRKAEKGSRSDGNERDGLEAFQTFGIHADQRELPDAVEWNHYEVHITNRGGLVTPVLLEFHFEDGSSLLKALPAEIWRYDQREIRKVFAFPKLLKSLHLDPEGETADINPANNYFPRDRSD